MSVRAANYPLPLPSGIEVNLKEKEITVKGKNGVLIFNIHPTVDVSKTDQGLAFSTSEEENNKFLGTAYATVKNMIQGVGEQGFKKILELVGVGYRAQVNGTILELNLGFSHPINFLIPQGIKITVEKQTSIIIEGHDKQKVGQVAANIKAYRPVEPYKLKGIRYADEKVVKKEVKKK